MAAGAEESTRDSTEVTDNSCSMKQFIFYLEILRASRPLSSLWASGRPEPPRNREHNLVLLVHCKWENVPWLLLDFQKDLYCQNEGPLLLAMTGRILSRIRFGFRKVPLVAV